MAKGKLGEQIEQQRAAERRAGKVGQQIGEKPTRAQIERARKEAQKKKEKLKQTQQKLKGKSLADYGQAYKKLPSWQKQYFESPKEIKQEFIEKETQKYEKEIEKVKQERQEFVEKARQRAKSMGSEARAEYLSEMVNPKRNAYTAKLRELKRYKGQLQQGKLVGLEQASKIASKTYKQELKQEKLQEKYRQKREKLKELQVDVRKGRITSIEEIPKSYQKYFKESGEKPSDPFAVPGTYVSPEGYSMSISQKEGLKLVKQKGGKYYGEQKVYTKDLSVGGKAGFLEKLVPELYQPKLQEVQTGEFKGIPWTTLVKIDPTAPIGFGAGKMFQQPTAKEEQWYLKQPRDYQAKTGEFDFTERFRRSLLPVREAVGGGVETLSTGLKETITYPIAESVSSGLEYVETKTGVDLPTTLKETEQKAIQSTEWLKTTDKGTRTAVGFGFGGVGGGLLARYPTLGEVISGIGTGMVRDVKEKPLKQIAIYGATYGIGAAAKVVGAGISAAGKGLATRTGINLFSKSGAAAKVVGYGAGATLTGMYAVDVGLKPFPASGNVVFNS